MGIGKDSEDALAITKWKLPGQVTYILNSDLTRIQTKATGDFGGRCFGRPWFRCTSNPETEILSKRPFRDDFGTMSIEEVNMLLDRLSAVSKE
jgi:hypothetical protein